MKKALTLFFLVLVTKFVGQITLTGTEIRISGTQTGDQLRTFINNNPAAGDVVNRDITFNRDLRLNSNSVLTDNNAVYHFPGNRRFEPWTNSTANFTDITIHYSGTAKNHSFNRPYTANFTRVFYLQGVTSGRSDFFNNGNYTFNMNNVTFVSYGGSDFLHFQTATTLNNITITNAQGGMFFEPGARNAGQVQIINNLTLRGVPNIVGGSGANGDFKTYNMDWDATTWNFNQRNVDFFFVNPVKPAGWTGYSGSVSRVREYYTHDVTVTDASFNPLNNIAVRVYNNNDASFDYTQNTNASGEITQQEILKIHNVPANTDRGLSTLVVADYAKNYYAVPRNFNEPIEDNVVLTDDEFITETNTGTVAGYTGITINHGTKQITVSGNSTLCELYDFIKLNKINNLNQPSIDTFLATPSTDILDIADYDFVLTASGTINACDKFVKLVTSSDAIIANTTNLGIGLQDSDELYKFIQINNLVNADVLITDEATVPATTILSLTNFTGTSASVATTTSANVRILVTRSGYTDWSVIDDFSGTQDLYRYTVHQAPITSAYATSANQEDILFLAKKVLMKNQGILQQVNGSNPTLSINNVTQPATTQATEEKQDEILELLKRILLKTTVIKKSID